MTLAGSYAGPHERERFRREAEAVAALRHANIVQIYDVGDWAGRPYFTMELIEGGSLAQRLAGVPQPAHEAAALLATLAEAVHAAHQGGIVHRDLKPANILFTPDGTPKITDFGLARRLEGSTELTLSGVPLGTPSYMAPEQARGQSRAIGPAADVYALGAILYEMLTGRPPFRAESAAETVHQLLTQDPVPPSRLNGKVPRDLETICLKCLSKEPRLRYPTADALNDDLGRFLRGDAISARPEGRMRRAIRAVRRRPTLAVGGIAVALFAALVLAGGLWLLFDRAFIDRALASDLNEIEELLNKCSFTEAKAAIERAQARLGTREPPAHRLRLNQSDFEIGSWQNGWSGSISIRRSLSTAWLTSNKPTRIMTRRFASSESGGTATIRRPLRHRSANREFASPCWRRSIAGPSLLRRRTARIGSWMWRIGRNRNPLPGARRPATENRVGTRRPSLA